MRQIGCEGSKLTERLLLLTRGPAVLELGIQNLWDASRALQSSLSGQAALKLSLAVGSVTTNSMQKM